MFLKKTGRRRSVWREALWDGRLLWLRHAVPCLFGGERVDPYVWDVIDVESGSRIATVETTAGLRLLAVAPDRVLGVTRDVLGVERGRLQNRSGDRGGHVSARGL